VCTLATRARQDHHRRVRGAKISSLAAREVPGVESLGGTISGALSTVVGRVRGDEHRTGGVGVEVGTRQAAVDLTMTVRYPYPIHEVAEPSDRT
jgi:uncharacterized alkaline shock family protein YloU